MWDKIKQAWNSEDLRRRIGFTLLMIAVYRIGSYIPCPFISVAELRASMENAAGRGSIFGIADMFTGGAFSQMTVFALGIMPYISASIIFQLLAVVWPTLQKIQKEGTTGQKKINQWTRYGTVGLAFFQGFGLSLYVRQNPEWIMPFMRDHVWLFTMIMVLSITAGTTLLMWIGEKITEKGIGNGISLLIALSIMAFYWPHIRAAVRYVNLEVVEPIWIVLTAVFCVAATMLIVLIQEGQRKIPIQHAKQAGGGRRMSVAQTNYLPLKVNTAGVMPVIFSSAILTLPPTLFGFIGASGNQMGLLGELFSPTSYYNLYNLFDVQKESIFLLLKVADLYTLTFAVLTAFFCFFYTAIVFNPQDVAENLRKVGAFVPGYRPGKPTADYIDKVMTRITLVGAVFLVSVSLIPQVLMYSFNIPFELADFAGGTGLIIVVAVVLDTMKQAEARMLTASYEGVRSRRLSPQTAKKWAQEKKL